MVVGEKERNALVSLEREQNGAVVLMVAAVTESAALLQAR